MGKLPRVGKKWDKSIKKWLKFKRDDSLDSCPFNLNSFSDINSCLKTYCGVIFPRVKIALEERKSLHRLVWEEVKCCPCELYTKKYVNKVAHRYLKENK